MSQPQHKLEGRHVLVVEDEYYIATDMVEALEALDAHVVGPAASVADAVNLVERTEHLDGAVVDLNLRGEMAFPVARALNLRHVPFVFATGYDSAMIPPEFHDVIRCEKPIDFVKVAGLLFAAAPHSPATPSAPPTPHLPFN